MYRIALKGPDSANEQASRSLVARLPFGLRKLLLVSALFIIGACSTSPIDLVESGRLAMKIADNHAWYIRQVGIYEDETGIIIRGTVRPGNRSHIPKRYAGHIDVLITSPDGDQARVETVDLRSRQSYFSYRLRSPVTESAQVTIAYSVKSHSRHAKALPGWEAAPDLGPEAFAPGKDQ